MSETPEEVAQRIVDQMYSRGITQEGFASALRAQYVAGLEKAAEMLNRQADGCGDASDYADEMAHAIRELAEQAKKATQ